jgi:Ca2+-binding EF-hand superfamily protein
MQRFIIFTVITMISLATIAESPPSSEGSPGSAFIKTLDADGNGSVSKDEFTQPQMQQIIKQFDYMDKNHDSQIDMPEADAFAQEMHKHMQQMQGQMNQ